MKTITYSQIADAVSSLTECCTKITPSCLDAMKRMKCDSEVSKFAVDTLLENAATSEKRGLPVCQDTGMAVVFVELGQDVHITGGLLFDAVNEGVRRGYKEHSLRASVLDPITRINTRDNTPCVLHVKTVSGDSMNIKFMPKGFGSENMSKLYMLKPSDGIDGIKRSVLSAVKDAGANPCPPIVVGVGIGGTAEKAMLIAKEQLLRDVGSRNGDEFLSRLESELLDEINALGIGVQGYGSGDTAFAVHIGKYPTHISALPVAVNIQCNAVRLATVTL